MLKYDTPFLVTFRTFLTVPVTQDGLGQHIYQLHDAQVQAISQKSEQKCFHYRTCFNGHSMVERLDL